jgi:hypothetical protein
MMTLTELAEAYKRGEKIQPLMIDNDVCDAVRVDTENDPDWRNAEDVFSMHPDELLEQALDLLGIPHARV